jgi:hypothetical protein
LQGHRDEISNLKFKENVRLTTMDEEEYLEMNRQLKDSACFGMPNNLDDWELLP